MSEAWKEEAFHKNFKALKDKTRKVVDAFNVLFPNYKINVYFYCRKKVVGR